MQGNEQQMRRPKVAFFDIDGTIVGRSGKVSPLVRKSIKALEVQGVAIALATGRPWFGAREIIAALEVKRPSMFCSGAVVVDPASGTTLRASSLSSTIGQQVTEFCRSEKLYFEWYSSGAYYSEVLNDLSTIHSEYLGILPQCNPFVVNANLPDIVKMVIVCRDEEQESSARQFLGKIPEVNVGVGAGAAHPGIRFVNITSVKARREDVFEYFLDLYKVSPEEVIAFGDSEADLPFLERAGWGVAPDNAAAAVKSRVRHVCASVEEDGVAVAIEAILRGARWDGQNMPT